MGFCVSLKFCIYHIKLNVIDKFKNDDVDINIVEHVLIKLQRASNVQEYSHVLQEIREKCDIIYDYIMTIHPTSYSVFGNKSLTNEEKELIDSVWADSLKSFTSIGSLALSNFSLASKVTLSLSVESLSSKIVAVMTM